MQSKLSNCLSGVLQRFGIAYLIVGTVQALLAARELPRLDSEDEIPWWWNFRDILSCLSQWAVMLIILTLHTYLTFFIPVPGKFIHFNFLSLLIHMKLTLKRPKYLFHKKS